MKLILTPIENSLIGVETGKGRKGLPHFHANLGDLVLEDEEGGKWVEADVCLSLEGPPSSGDIESHFERAIQTLRRVGVPIATVAFELPNAGFVHVLIARYNGSDEGEEE